MGKVPEIPDRSADEGSVMEMDVLGKTSLAAGVSACGQTSPVPVA
jgi:hypothetical protein